jgi:transposase, IS30 family
VAGGLTLAEREEISRGVAVRESLRSIASRLGRAPSTISREVGRNTLRAGRGWAPYRAWRAQQLAVRRGHRRRPRRLLVDQQLRGLVLEKLRLRWSPQQISRWLRETFPDRPELQVSHETIYRAIYIQTRGSLRLALAEQVAGQKAEQVAGQKALRHGHARRHPRRVGPVVTKRPWVDLHISARPAAAADRAVPGHWEGDLLIGSRNQSAIATLVERATRFVLLVALPGGKVSEHVVAQLTEAMLGLPTQLRRSLTWDQGHEMALHQQFSIATDCEVYFCDPHSPWQRGSNENTNGLLRDYWPKNTVFTHISQTELDEVATQLNTRPRMTLGWKTPAARLNELLGVAMTT